MKNHRRLLSSPTAKEIMGVPGMLPSRRQRQYREAALERAIF
jgi:hypothetical protein